VEQSDCGATVAQCKEHAVGVICPNLTSDQKIHMPNRPWIPWKRWWTPLGGPIHVEQAGGFLRDPLSEFGRFYPLNVFPLDNLVQRHCLVLHGDPAMGKTAELDELEKRLE